MDILLNVELVTSGYNLKALRQLYDTIESHVRGLKSLGVASESYGLNKLPQELQLIISRKVGSGEWELDRLMKLLEEEVEAREKATVHTTAPLKKPTKSPVTAAALMTKGSDTGPTCCYCNQSHYSHTCKTVDRGEEACPSINRQVLCLHEERPQQPTVPIQGEMYSLPWPPSWKHLPKGFWDRVEAEN